MSTIHEELQIRPQSGDRAAGPPENKPQRGLLLIAAVAVAAAIGAWVWHGQPPQPVAPTPPIAEAPPAQPAPVAPTAPAIHYPLEQAPEQPLEAGGLTSALVDLLGAKAVAAFLQTDDFARRMVATIDNLGRDSAPVAAWPVRPTGGRFAVDEGADGTVIAADNASRYTPFVQMVGAVDAVQAARLYRRLYPLLQRTYRELGFGDRYLNDRVVEVIDLLLATPEPAQAPRLHLTEVKGPVPSTRPWVRYQFEDPQLESLAAGQKILLRVGLANERTLKAKLAQLRAQIVR